jgi:predicted DNA binding protein
MREYAFTVHYEPGVDPVADVFIEHPSAVATSLAIAATREGLWRVDRITGPEAALEELETAFLDPEHCNECIGTHPECDATRRYRTIEADGGRRTVYAHLEGVEDCHSVPSLASRHLGDGLLFDAQRRGGRYEWRLLLPYERSVGELFDAVQRDLPDGVTVALESVGTPTRWGADRLTVADLPHEQREALETAVAVGYYETPRDATLADLAAELDVPESTCRYRLRRAEAWLTTRFVEGTGMLDDPSAGPAVEARSD